MILFSLKIIQIHNQNEPPEKFCVPKDRYLTISLELDREGLNGQVNTSMSYMTLKITATLTSEGKEIKV